MRAKLTAQTCKLPLNGLGGFLRLNVSFTEHQNTRQLSEILAEAKLIGDKIAAKRPNYIVARLASFTPRQTRHF
jgi:hypothetical protein